MNAFERNTKLLAQIAIGSAVVAIVSLGLAITALTSSNRAGTAVVTDAPVVEGKVKELTADNPASTYQNFKNLRVIDGIVVRTEGDTFVVRSGESEHRIDVSGTRLYAKGEAKDPDVFEREMQEFRDTINTHAVGVQEIFIPPFPYTMVPISPSDVAPNTIVSIYFEGTRPHSVYVMQ